MAAREAEADEFYAALAPPRRRPSDAGPAPGVRGLVWSKQMYPYDVRRWLDGDPGEPPPPSGHSARPQRELATPRLLRRARDARPVGVPVVRRLGPRLPRGAVGAPRPGLREVPAPRAAPRVVHAPERGAARLRVELRRRQPARARHGRAPRVPDRRQPRPSSSSSGSSRSSSSTTRGGSTARTPTATTSSAAASSASTTSARSTARTCRPASSSSRRTAPRGWPTTRSRCS